MPSGTKHIVAILSLLAWLCLGTPARAEATLYDDLGGEAGVTAIVGSMIDNALKDDRIKVIFDDVNIPRLKGLIARQFCMLTGGGCEYKRRSMKDTHAGLNLRDADFNALVEDLEAAMDARGVPWRTQARLLAILAPMEHEMVHP